MDVAIRDVTELVVDAAAPRPAGLSLLLPFRTHLRLPDVLFDPPPIGFSYCDGQKGTNTGPSGDGYSCGPWNDTSVAKANHAFLKNLFATDFKEFANNPLFITGESYAGICDLP